MTQIEWNQLAAAADTIDSGLAVSESGSDDDAGEDGQSDCGAARRGGGGTPRQRGRIDPAPGESTSRS